MKFMLVFIEWWNYTTRCKRLSVNLAVWSLKGDHKISVHLRDWQFRLASDFQMCINRLIHKMEPWNSNHRRIILVFVEWSNTQRVVMFFSVNLVAFYHQNNGGSGEIYSGLTEIMKMRNGMRFEFLQSQNWSKVVRTAYIPDCMYFFIHDNYF